MAVQFPFSPFDNTPAGELEHHQLLLLRRGEISSPHSAPPHPCPRLLTLHAGESEHHHLFPQDWRVAWKIGCLLSPVKTAVKEYDFLLVVWYSAGIAKKVFVVVVRLLFS